MSPIWHKSQLKWKEPAIAQKWRMSTWVVPTWRLVAANLIYFISGAAIPWGIALLSNEPMSTTIKLLVAGLVFGATTCVVLNLSRTEKPKINILDKSISINGRYYKYSDFSNFEIRNETFQNHPFKVLVLVFTSGDYFVFGVAPEVSILNLSTTLTQNITNRLSGTK